MTIIRKTIGPCAIYQGDCIDIIPQLQEELDAVVTDPPYSSGAGTLYGKSIEANTKYQQTGTRKKYPAFGGDAKDQMTWTLWIRTILALSKTKSRPGAYFLSFTDWRQLAAAIVAMQFADISFRGIIPWDKTESARAPHKGYFRQQAGEPTASRKKRHTADRGTALYVAERIRPKSRTSPASRLRLWSISSNASRPAAWCSIRLWDPHRPPLLVSVPAAALSESRHRRNISPSPKKEFRKN